MKTHVHSFTENHTLSTMLHAASHSLFFSPLSLSSPLLRRLKPHRAPFPPLTSAIRMSATTTTQIVEHFVLFKVKPETEPSKVSAMVDGLNGLISIDGVLHLTAGEILRNRSSSLTFTHLIHSRYKSKEDLAAYSANPRHIGLVRGTIFPIIDDMMVIDFVSGNVAGPVIPTPGSAMRITLLKLKEGLGEKEKREVLGVIGGIKDQFESIDQLSFGENFTVERSKGFSIGSLAICKGLSELDCLDSNSELVNLQKEKVKDLLEKVVVLDYVIPQSV